MNHQHTNRAPFLAPSQKPWSQLYAVISASIKPVERKTLSISNSTATKATKRRLARITGLYTTVATFQSWPGSRTHSRAPERRLGSIRQNLVYVTVIPLISEVKSYIRFKIVPTPHSIGSTYNRTNSSTKVLSALMQATALISDAGLCPFADAACHTALILG